MAKKKLKDKCLFIGKYSGEAVSAQLRNYKFGTWEPVVMIGKFPRNSQPYAFFNEDTYTWTAKLTGDLTETKYVYTYTLTKEEIDGYQKWVAIKVARKLLQ